MSCYRGVNMRGSKVDVSCYRGVNMRVVRLTCHVTGE